MDSSACFRASSSHCAAELLNWLSGVLGASSPSCCSESCSIAHPPRGSLPSLQSIAPCGQYSQGQQVGVGSPLGGLCSTISEVPLSPTAFRNSPPPHREVLCSLPRRVRT